MLEEEISKKLKITPRSKVLDIGGSMMQRTSIQVDTLVDIIHPKNAPYNPSELKAKHFEMVDIVRQPLPFKDKAFDIVLCTHTLEDLLDPVLVIVEMQRVAKRGFITTPSMGADMVFSHVDNSTWLTGFTRVPGHAHHKWFFEVLKGKLMVIPKNYPLLYSPEFQVSGWSGEPEVNFFWEGEFNWSVYSDIYFHRLITLYRDFFDRNRRKIIRRRTLLYFDNPIHYGKQIIKALLHKGTGFERHGKE